MGKQSSETLVSVDGSPSVKTTVIPQSVGVYVLIFILFLDFDQFFFFSNHLSKPG